MKDLLTRIKRKIRDRRIRRLLTQLVSAVAAVVIFMTTYALVLPAITMEGKAKCGMEAHQHDDSCYEEVLVCDIPESDGHHHDDSCYKISEELVCNQEEHQHSDACYDEEGNLICELPEHTHGKGCYEEKRELVCEIPESEGHHHDASCYKKVLTCGKEAHAHSEACYQDAEQDSASGNAANPAASENNGADGSATENTSDVLTDADNAGTAETVLPEQEQEAMVPELDPLDFKTILNKKTGVYYYHVKPEEKVEDSSQIADWTRAKDKNGDTDDSTELTSDDLIRVYLSYTIPGGSLNTTNPTARYRLPDSIRLTDNQIKAINKAENGISRQYDDKDKHDEALGAEAIEGTRRPDQDIDDYLEKNGQEYISATVKAENVFNDETGEYEGQDLIFTFAPYTVEKNQNVYDAAGEKTKSGEKVHGWFTFDLTTDQVEWGEPTITRTETGEADEKTEGENTEAENADVDNTEAENAEAENTEADNSAEETDTADSKVTSTIIERSERTAEIEFVVEENDKVETTLKLVEEKETENTEKDETDPADEEAVPEFSAGTLETSGDGYKITLDYTAEAQIPENASLSVREITADTDPEAYEACLEQAGKKIASEDSDNVGGKRSTIDENASRFFDIEIVVTGTDENGQETSRKIEPKAEVSVNIQITDTAAKTSGDSAENAGENDNTSKSETQGTQEPTVLHFTDDGVEKLDSTVVDEKNAASDGEAAASENNGSEDAKNTDSASSENGSTEIQFTTESFSIYGVVYTVDFHAEVISASGDTYEVTVRYEADAMIPDGAELRVREILPEDEEYQAVQEKAGKELAEEMKKTIPAHPVLFDIAIYNGETKIEPAEGSTVQVEVKLVKDSITGIYSDENSPVLINDKPVEEEELKNVRKLQVIHDTEGGELDVVEVQEQNDDEHVVGQFTTDSFSNWLVFLDEDLADINVTTSDSLTLRPYTEWVWKTSNGQQEGNWTFPTSDWNTTTGREWINNQWVNFTYYTHKTNGSQFRSYSKYDDQLHETYTVITSTQLNAGNFDIQNDKGKTIHVHVTQGSASPAPAPVPGVPNLTVNLFDYDVPTKNGQLDFTRSGNLDSSGNKATTVYNETVNIGHNLKFLGWGADGDGHGVNSYTNEYAKQEIVKDELSGGFPVLNDGSNQKLDYLFDVTSKNSSVYAFPNAGGLFQKDNQGYYFYNSNVNYAKYDLDSNQFILYGHTYSQNTGGSNGANAKPIGFFPFHEYDTSETQSEMNHNKELNHHFGMSMSVDFEIPKDRQMEDQNGNKHDIIYEFSGDDDLWVFVDDELALDIGGIHQPVTGSINFTTGVIKVHGEDDITKTFDVGGHTLKMFYLERGGCDSNLSVKFNLPLVKGKAGVNVAKKSLENASSNPDQFLPGAVFGIWENENCSGDPYMTGTSDANGHIDFGDLPIKTDGQKYYIKEIVPPQGYLPNTTVFTATAGEKDQNGNYSFTITDGTTPVETIGLEPVYAIVRDQKPEPINLTIQKKWENADGTTLENPSGNATFELKRHYTYIEGSVRPENSVIKVYRVDSSWNNPKLMKTEEYAGDTTAYVSWTYNTYLDSSFKNWEYRVNNGSSQYKGNDPVAVPLTAGSTTEFYIRDGNLGTQWEEYGVENITVTGTEPSSDPGEITTGEGEDTEYQGPVITLPTAGGAWSDTFSNLVAFEKKGDRTYYYTYYIVEKNVPDGFETVYYDGQNHQIPDPASLQTNTSGTQTIANRKLMDVPVIKDWEDFSGDEFTWTADFQLEERELKVNSSDPDADDAITQWTAVDGKTLRVTKGQTPTPVFTGLPRYRMHSNGTLYRILYSVEETAYEVKEGDTVVSKWDAEHGHTIGHRYTPQFTQDAGGNEQGEKPYEIKLANTLHNPTVTNTINLSLKKEWTAGGSDYNPGNGASARFVLKRFYHEEYRNYSHVEDMTDLVTITLDVAGTGTNPTITVPRGAMVSISGKVLAGVNANSIQFTRQDGTVLTKIIDNTTSQSLKPFDITFEATQDETVTLYRGDNYVSGGREGFRLTDHGDQNTPKVDKHFSQEFTLDESVNWIKQFSSLPQIEEDEMDEVSHVQTITVYTYYFEEVDCTPTGFHPVFETTNGQLLADENNPVDTSQNLIAENQANEGSLKLKKLVRVNEFDPLGDNVPDADKTKADGTYTFTIVGKEGTKTAGQSHTVTITVLNGAVSSATIDGSATTLGSDGSVLLSGLVIGQYTVTEEENANTVCIGVSADQTIETDVDNRTAEITVVEDVPDVETQYVQYTNNYASSGEDIAHVSVRKTFIGLKPSELPANFQVNAAVNAIIDGVERTFTYTLKGPSNQQEDGVTLTTSTDQDGNPVWNWRIAIAGLRPDAVLTIEETGYPVAGYDVSTTTNGVANKTKYEGTVSADTVIQNFESHVFTPNNVVTFPVNDTGDTATIFMARLTSDKTTLVISKNRLTLSEKAKIEEQLKHMENAEDWTHGGNAVLYFNFEEAGSDQIIIKGRTVTYSDDNGGQITFNKKCQWTMIGSGYITYVPGRPADVNFVNRYTEIPLEIDIIKVDKENSSTKLKGAVFTLRKLSGPADHPEDPPEPLPSGEFPGTPMGDSEATALDTGKTSFSNLTSGYYEITEKTPPAGYVLTDTSPIYFKIAGGSVTRIEWSAEQSKWIDKGDDAMVSFEEAHEASGENPASNATFTVGNTPGAALPSTGGPGARLFTLFGVLLIGLSGAGLVMKRRRRNEA